MKMTKALLLLLALVFAFAITSCGDDGDGGGGGGKPTVFDGTWKGTSYYTYSYNILLYTNEFTFSKNTFSTIFFENFGYCKGTFTFKELEENKGTIPLNFSQFRYNDGKWYTRAEYIDMKILEPMNKEAWNRYTPAEKQKERDAMAEKLNLPTTETGSYSLKDDDILILVFESVKDAFYWAGEGPGPIPPGSWTPPNNPTTLRENQWVQGSITSSGTGTGEQWFKFTATASEHYIHYPRGVGYLYLRLYDSTGSLVGKRSYNLVSNFFHPPSLTSGQTYYIRVWPYSYGNNVNYSITFNTSVIAPN
jgi:hypothetical protein